MTTPAPTVSEAVARPIRGVAQGGLGWLLTDLLVEFGHVDLTERQYGLAVLVLGALASAAQNLAENKGWLKPFLRQIPPTEVPVVDDAGHTSGDLLALVFAITLGVVLGGILLRALY